LICPDPIATTQRCLGTGFSEAHHRLTGGRSLDDFESDRDRRDALLWNFTVLGEAVGQLSDAIKHAHPGVAWMAPIRMRSNPTLMYLDLPA
jgi:uncharacterized protein with HEPN domain